MKYFLLPISWLYGAIVACRNKAFDLGLLRSENVGVPVISVGNMTMGGTGKTPLVEYIVAMCIERGRRVAVVSRGYKRESKGVLVVSDGKQVSVDALRGGDEPVQIARKYRRAIVVVGERRVEAARKSVKELHADVIVLDDGFQHRYLQRDLDIVVLYSRRDLFATPMIPAGERRETMKGLRRSHLMAFSHTDAGGHGGGWSERLGSKFSAPKIKYRYKLDRIMQTGSDKNMTPRDLKGKQMLLLSGIGDHEGFVRQMSMAGIEVAGEIKFPDHHSYTSADLRMVMERLTQKGADGVLTTEKDYVRLSGNMTIFNRLNQRCPVFYAGIVVEVLDGKPTLDSMIDRCLARRVA